jgi:hypothetical protein
MSGKMAPVAIRQTHDVRNFFVGITPTQNSRHGIKFFIQTWCVQQRDKWPKDGETITIDLDEVQIARQR